MGCCFPKSKIHPDEDGADNQGQTTTSQEKTKSRNRVLGRENSTINMVANKGSKHNRDALKTSRANLEAKINEGDFAAVKKMVSGKKHALILNHIDQGGMTPLMYAAQNGKDEILKTLLDAKADLMKQDFQYRSVLLRTAENHNSDNNQETQAKIIRILVENKADVNVQTIDKKKSAIMASTENFNDVVVDTLIELKADVNAQDWNKQTALHFAAKATFKREEKVENEQRVAIVKSLLENGAKIGLTDKWNETPLAICQRKKNDASQNPLILDLLQGR